MAETDPATLGDAELLRRIRDGVDPSAAAELRRRHLHGLTTVAAGYVRDLRRRGISPGPDPRAVVEEVLTDAATLLPVDVADGEVFLGLCAQTRIRLSEADPDTRTGPGPDGLIDLVGPQQDPYRAEVAAAYGALNERDRVLLWFMAAEGSLPNQLMATLSIGSADQAATLAHRARSAFRRAYLDRRDLPEPDESECRARQTRLVSVVEEPTIGDVAHLRDCASCRTATAELHELTNRLSGLVAAVIAGPTVSDTVPLTTTAAAAATATVPAVAGPVTAGTPGSGPLVITTTPALESTRALPGAVAATTAVPLGGGDGAAHDDGDDDPTGTGPSRRRWLVVSAVGVCIVVLAVLSAWLATEQSSEGPADAGVPVHEPTSVPATSSTSSTTSTSTTTSSTTTTTTVAATPAPSTVPPTPAPAPVPDTAAPPTDQPVWVPPATQAPSVPAPTDPPVTAPPTTAAPVTPAPTDPPGEPDP